MKALHLAHKTPYSGRGLVTINTVTLPLPNSHTLSPAPLVTAGPLPLPGIWVGAGPCPLSHSRGDGPSHAPFSPAGPGWDRAMPFLPMGPSYALPHMGLSHAPYFP